MKSFYSISTLLLSMMISYGESKRPTPVSEATRVIQEKNRKITLKLVKAPPETAQRPKRAEVSNVVVVPSENVTAEKEPISFTISATVIDDQITMLEWKNSSAPKTIAFSNVNWKHFGGFQTIEDDARRYTAVIFSQSLTRAEFEQMAASSGDRIPDHLPALTMSGARYTTADTSSLSPAMVGFLETMHLQYDENGEAIRQAYQQRQSAREEKERQARENPQEQEEVVIQFWKREPHNKTQSQ